MFRIHTKMDIEGTREAFRRLVASRDRATGQVEGDKFRLHPKPRRRGVPVTIYGRIAPDREGTVIAAWSFPHGGMILLDSSLDMVWPPVGSRTDVVHYPRLGRMYHQLY